MRNTVFSAAEMSGKLNRLDSIAGRQAVITTVSNAFP